MPNDLPKTSIVSLSQDRSVRSQIGVVQFGGRIDVAHVIVNHDWDIRKVIKNDSLHCALETKNRKPIGVANKQCN
jgi:hypothetical protein